MVLPRLLGWDIHQDDEFFLTFLVATHAATAAVLVAFFWRDWLRIVRGLGRSLRDRGLAEGDADARLGWLLVAGTIPAGLLGLALEHPLRTLFASALVASVCLMLNGVMLYGAERLRRRAPSAPEHGDDDVLIARRLTFRGALGIGAAQAIALVPGFSRSGASMAGGLLAGLSNELAARFSFLLATPIIAAAALLKLPSLLGPAGDGVRGPALVGAVCAAASAFVSVRFLLRYFETRRLTPFAVYCIAVGAILTATFAIT